MFSGEFLEQFSSSKSRPEVSFLNRVTPVHLAPFSYLHTFFFFLNGQLFLAEGKFEVMDTHMCYII